MLGNHESSTMNQMYGFEGEVKEKYLFTLNPLSANPEKWSSTLKGFVGNLPTNYLPVFDHFVGLTFKVLISAYYY